MSCGACACWLRFILATFQIHKLGLTLRSYWRSGSYCGMRGLLISRLVIRWWRRVWLCLSGICGVFVCSPVFTDYINQVNKLVNLVDHSALLMYVVVLDLAFCCSLSWLLVFPIGWIESQSSQLLLKLNSYLWLFIYLFIYLNFNRSNYKQLNKHY